MPRGDARGEETDQRMTDQERDPEADGGTDAAPGEPDDATIPDEEQAVDEADGEGDEAEGELEEEGEGEPEREPEPEPARPAAAAQPPSRRGRAPAPTKAAAPSVSEQAVRVSDRASAVFVIGVTGVFVAMLLYGMLLGHGGFVTDALATPRPTKAPTPVPTVTAAPSASAPASAAPSASSAASAAPSASAAASAAPSPSPAPSAS
jgi:2-oxoglutarate dehydrogenase E2 component (dihydrolipoamide succinyltransferase)